MPSVCPYSRAVIEDLVPAAPRSRSMIGRSTSGWAAAVQSTQTLIGAPTPRMVGVRAAPRYDGSRAERGRAGSGPSGRRCARRATSFSASKSSAERGGDHRGDLAHVVLARPRVVSAGVPIRRPEGFIGGRSSKGIALRLTVIPTSSRRSSAVWPSSPVGVEVDEHEVDVGAAGEDRDAARFRPAARARALAIVCRWRARNGSLRGDPQGHRLGGDRVHQRPALLAGEDRFVDRFRVLLAAEDHAAARAAEGLVDRSS